MLLCLWFVDIWGWRLMQQLVRNRWGRCFIVVTLAHERAALPLS